MDFSASFKPRSVRFFSQDALSHQRRIGRFAFLFCPSWLKKFAFPHPHAMLKLQEIPAELEIDKLDA